MQVPSCFVTRPYDSLKYLCKIKIKNNIKKDTKVTLRKLSDNAGNLQRHRSLPPS